MKDTDTYTQTIGEIVASDFRTAYVFKEAGIDFCCGGKKTLNEACAEKGIDPEKFMEKLEGVETRQGATVHNFREWDPGFLCDYIVNVHHSFVRKALPDLVFYTKKIASVHGDNHPELQEVASLFLQVNNELLQHMQKEEEVLFPAIKDLTLSGPDKAKSIVRSEISRLSGEHEFAGGAIDRISTITNHYELPEDACNSYRIAFDMLEKFEDDLHTHVHLENNVLFPEVIKKTNK